MLRRKLTIIIPCKNEESYIGNLLDDLAYQVGIEETKVIIADGNSTDSTLSVIEHRKLIYEGILDIVITEGGKVSRARNNGAALANTPFLLFIDADTRLFDPFTIVDTLNHLEHRGKKLLTCKLKCYEGTQLDNFLFSTYNYVHAGLTKFTPFAIGTYFMVRAKDFNYYGKFNEDSNTCEDFLFSQNFSVEEFCFHDHYVGQDNRRLLKMGRLGMAKYLLTNLISHLRKDNKRFQKDVGYW